MKGDEMKPCTEAYCVQVSWNTDTQIAQEATEGPLLDPVDLHEL